MKTTTIPINSNSNGRRIVWDDITERCSDHAHEMRDVVNAAKRKVGLLKHRLSKAQN